MEHPNWRDDPKERRERALIGRRGCREATSVSDRLAILAYVIWHQDSVLAEQELELKMAFSPGCVASHMAAAFKYEFGREAKLAAHAERERKREQMMSLYDRARHYRQRDRDAPLKGRNCI